MVSTPNRHNLTEIMSFDHVIEVHPDGTVTEPETVWAPEVSVSGGNYRRPDVDARPSEPWQLVNGFSGQYLYSGPIMHNSETIGGALADHILETPGYYCAVVVTDLDSDDEAAGWAVAWIDTSDRCDRVRSA